MTAYDGRIDNRRQQGRRWRLPALLAGLAALVAAFTQTVLAAGGAAPGPLPGDGGYLGWPARGDRATDPALVDAAVAAWDAASGQRHDRVRTLFAGSDSLLGAVAIVEGRAASGQLRLAVAVEQTRPGAGGELRLLDERPAPDPAATRQVSLVTRRLPAVSGDGALVLALAEPQARVTELSSWAWDAYGSFEPRELAVAVVPAAATASNVVLTVTRDGARVHDGPLDETAESRSGTYVGDALVHGLPAGAVAQPVVVESEDGARTTARDFTSGADGALRVTEVREPGLTIERLVGHVAPGTRLAPANPRGATAMSEVVDAGVRGFVWLEAPGVGYAVVGRGERAVGIDAYHVAHAIELR